MRHVHDGVLGPGPDVAPRTLRAPPGRPRRPGPPLAQVPQVDGSRGRGEDHRPGDQVLRRRTGEVRRVERAFGHGDVAGRRDERRVLGVRHGGARDQEVPHLDGARRRLLGVVRVGPHPERAGRDPHEVVRRAHALGRPALSLFKASVMPNDAASCRGGNSKNDAAICATNACAGTSRNAWSSIQSQ